MPLLTNHLPSLEPTAQDDAVTSKPSIADYAPPSQTNSLPVLPPRSTLRASRIMSPIDLSSRLSEPFSHTAPNPTTSSTSTTPELSPSNANPYDSYLSEEDASESADEYDFSTLAIIYPSGLDEGVQDSETKSREDVARIVEFMFVGKPTVVSISLPRPASALSRPSLPPRRDSIPKPAEPAPKLPRRPTTLSITTSPKPTRGDYPDRTTSSMSYSTPTLPFLKTDPFDSSSMLNYPSPSSSQHSTGSGAKEAFKRGFGDVRRGLVKGAAGAADAVAAARRRPSMGRINAKFGEEEGKGRRESRDLLGSYAGRASTVTLDRQPEEESGRVVREERSRPVRYEDIMRAAIHAPPPPPLSTSTSGGDAMSPRMSKMKSGVLGFGRRRSIRL